MQVSHSNIWLKKYVTREKIASKLAFERFTSVYAAGNRGQTFERQKNRQKKEMIGEEWCKNVQKDSLTTD